MLSYHDLRQANVHRRTLDAFPATPQFWIESDSYVWWDLDFLHIYAFNTTRAAQFNSRKSFLNYFVRLARAGSLSLAEQVKVHLQTRLPKNASGYLLAKACDTKALITCCWLGADDSRNDGRVSKFWLELATQYFKQPCATLAGASQGESIISIQDVQLRVYPDGTVDNFGSLVNMEHSRVLDSLKLHWRELQGQGFIVGGLEWQRHSIDDIVSFLALLLRHCRLRKRAFGSRIVAFLERVTPPILRWACQRLDGYVQATYGVSNLITQRPAPALKRIGFEKRTYSRVSPEAAFDVIEQARIARANLAQALAMRRDQTDLGFGLAGPAVWDGVFDGRWPGGR